MGYSTVAQVREILNAEDDEDIDEELTNCIKTADAIVDTRLASKGLAADANSQTISDASAHFAAFHFRLRRDPAGTKVFLDEAEKFLSQFVDAEKYDEVGVRRG